MIKFNLVNNLIYICFGTYAVLLTAVAVYACVKTFSYRLNLKTRLVSLFIAITSSVVLIGISDISRSEIHMSPLAKFIGELPLYAVMSVLVFLSVGLASYATYLYQKLKTVLTPSAVKESLDNLPDGVCFSLKSGMPILVNTKMSRLCSELFEKSILNADRFFEDIKTKPLKNNAQLIRVVPNVTIKTADNQVWDFRRKTIYDNKNEIVELVAYNITTQYELNTELKKRNKRMDAVGERLRKFNREVTRVTREKEILNAIIRVHDDLGRALLMLRKYLAEPKDMRNREELLFLWQYNTAVMKNETDPNGEGSDWDVLMHSAENIGVKINLNGCLPKNERQKSVLIAALRECLTNTVKHANGNVIDVCISEENEKILIIITNNGKAPNGTIVEKGGLKNLRTIVEDANGNMTIESNYRFILKISLPKGV